MNNDTNNASNTTGTEGLGLPPIPSVPATPPPLPITPSPTVAPIPELNPVMPPVPAVSAAPTLEAVAPVTTTTTTTTLPSPVVGGGLPPIEVKTETTTTPPVPERPRRKANKKLVFGGALVLLLIGGVVALAAQLGVFTGEQRGRASCSAWTVNCGSGGKCYQESNCDTQAMFEATYPGAGRSHWESEACASGAPSTWDCGTGGGGGGGGGGGTPVCVSGSHSYCVGKSPGPVPAPDGTLGNCFKNGGSDAEPLCGWDFAQICSPGSCDDQGGGIWKKCYDGSQGQTPAGTRYKSECYPSQSACTSGSPTTACAGGGGGTITATATATPAPYCSDDKIEECSIMQPKKYCSPSSTGGTCVNGVACGSVPHGGTSCTSGVVKTCANGTLINPVNCPQGQACNTAGTACVATGTGGGTATPTPTPVVSCTGQPVGTSCLSSVSGLCGTCNSSAYCSGLSSCPTPVPTTTATQTPTATATPRVDSCSPSTTGQTCLALQSSSACINRGGDPDTCTDANGNSGNCCAPTAGATTTPPPIGGGGGTCADRPNGNYTCDGRSVGYESPGVCKCVLNGTGNNCSCIPIAGSTPAPTAPPGATCAGILQACDNQGTQCCPVSGQNVVCTPNTAGQNVCNVADSNICQGGGSCSGLVYGFKCTSLTNGQCLPGNPGFVSKTEYTSFAAAKAGIGDCGQVDTVCNGGSNQGTLCGGFQVYSSSCGAGVTTTATATPTVGGTTTETPTGVAPACVNTRIFINGSPAVATVAQMNAIKIGDSIRMVVMGNNASLVGAKFVVKVNGSDISNGGYLVTQTLTPMRADGVKEFYYDYTINRAGAHTIEGYVNSVPPSVTATTQPTPPACGTPNSCVIIGSCPSGRVVSGFNCPGQSDGICCAPATPTPTVVASDLPSCSVTGPTTLVAGTEYTFTGTFAAPASLAGEVYRDAIVALTCEGTCRSSNPRYYDFPATSGTHSWKWTPTAADVGTHTIACRAWHDSIKECRPAPIPLGSDFALCGSNSKMTVTVAATLGANDDRSPLEVLTGTLLTTFKAIFKALN